MKITDFFFRFAKIFQFFVVAPHQQIFEIFEKVEYLHDHEELNINNGTVIFSELSSFRKANNFLNPTHFNIIDFFSRVNLTSLLHLCNYEDSENGVGDIFGY